MPRPPDSITPFGPSVARVREKFGNLMDPHLGTAPAHDGSAAPGDRGERTLHRALGEARERIALLEKRIASEARARAELVNLVSHELRTPITVISGFSRLLQDEVRGTLNEAQHHFIEESLRACRRLDAFVSDLLEARPGADTPFKVVLSRGDLHETVEAQLESLSPLLEERGLTVEASLGCREPIFAFDARRIEQVITNLMTNAIRHARLSGVIRLSTRSVEVERSGHEPVAHLARVSVEDDGPGIPEADRERIFAPYVRGAHEASDSDEACGLDCSGLGIGLAISSRIIAAHGGRIWVEASALGGARFAFDLPRDLAMSGGD